MNPLLEQLKLSAQNGGVCTGPDGWMNESMGPEIISINPADGRPIASVLSATADAYEKIVSQAAQTFIEWRMRPAPARGEMVRKIGDALRRQKAALGHLVSLEMGKSLQEGLGEVQEMIDMADFAAGLSRQLYGLSMHSERPCHRMYEQWLPLGVTAVITAFNFPVAVWAWNAFLAAICGNTVIWKPSSKTPLCAVAVQHICNEVLAAEKLQGLFSLCVMADNHQAQQLVEDRRMALVSFTGSTPVGRKIGETVAQRMGRVLLELGGNNAIIVDETADLKLAVPAIVFGAMGTAGQRCTTTRRLIIHESIYATLKEALIAAYQQIRIGDPLDEKNLMGPLIDADAVTSFANAIAAVQQAGGKIVHGGRTLQRPGFFVEPTLIEAENQWDIVQAETFAPILYLLSYREMDDAIAMQNHARHGLSSALFTRNLQHAELFLSAQGSDCGIANINIGTSGAEIGGAFGGEKETGGGREAGSDAWKQYMRRQTVTLNWGDALPLAQGIRFDIG